MLGVCGPRGAEREPGAAGDSVLTGSREPAKIVFPTCGGRWREARGSLGYVVVRGGFGPFVDGSPDAA